MKRIKRCREHWLINKKPKAYHHYITKIDVLILSNKTERKTLKIDKKNIKIYIE